MRREIAEFYNTASQQQLDKIRQIQYYENDLRKRYSVIKEPGEWGEGVDVSAFASIHRIAIEVFHRQDTIPITFFPVDGSGNILENARVASTRLHHNSIDHWSVYQCSNATSVKTL